MMIRSGLIALALMLPLAAAPSIAAPPVPALDAGQFRQVLREQQGQVVLVNFWATWCRACLKEIPALLDLERQYHDRGFRLVAVSLDEPGDYAGVVAPFLDKWFPTLATYRRATADMDGLVSVLDPAWNELLPTSYVLDRAGAVRARIQGGKPVEEFAAAIRPWLDQEPAPAAAHRP
ncbi:MAG: hypothetical protein BroJett010_07520 [Gammaproteobacteria bacterium]|nr:MAG: TlpA family protein disulfide reductase [Pseudomonadota bacterium]MCE7901076.1 TlpA family protein disulfide reductase [Gammaproteobacteria bacterium PRO9]MCL4776240.1 TlpA family protein disulfide reductase [Gammaproteobacteria bacterium]MCQ3933370.1 TlpA family protein disulfide reductase [Gammaproteobacteria bacterium]GIK34193.1 MAG: hypothetical protein BroJett010_07520 [Gammaproteobacteria bacterium]